MICRWLVLLLLSSPEERATVDEGWLAIRCHTLRAAAAPQRRCHAAVNYYCLLQVSC